MWKFTLLCFLTLATQTFYKQLSPLLSRYRQIRRAWRKHCAQLIACENIRFSLLFAQEKRMFSQATQLTNTVISFRSKSVN